MNVSSRIAIVSLIAWACADPAIATSSDPLVEVREEHWFEAMEIGGVDSEILYAIALTESGTSFKGLRPYGPWPWAMNVNEEPKFYSSREAARKDLAREVAKGNKQIAVGMWQIHLRYNSHYVEDPLDLIDPVTNLYVAAMVLKDCGRNYSTTRDVLSCYHSGDVDEAGVKYAEKVLRLARQWGQPYRLGETPSTVRFTHDDVTNVQRDGAEEQIAVAGQEDPAAASKNGSRKISLRMMVSVDKPPVTRSHKDFLRRIGDGESSSAKRVVLVD